MDGAVRKDLRGTTARGRRFRGRAFRVSVGTRLPPEIVLDTLRRAGLLHFRFPLSRLRRLDRVERSDGLAGGGLQARRDGARSGSAPTAPDLRQPGLRALYMPRPGRAHRRQGAVNLAAHVTAAATQAAHGFPNGRASVRTPRGSSVRRAAHLSRGTSSSTPAPCAARDFGSRRIRLAAPTCGASPAASSRDPARGRWHLAADPLKPPAEDQAEQELRVNAPRRDRQISERVLDTAPSSLSSRHDCLQTWGTNPCAMRP